MLQPDQRIERDLVERWFGFFFRAKIETDRPVYDFVKNAYSLIASMQITQDQAVSDVRFYCDNDPRGNFGERWTLTIDDPEDLYRNSRRGRAVIEFEDHQNGVKTAGRGCGAGAYWAITYTAKDGIDYFYALQNPLRSVITICDKALYKKKKYSDRQSLDNVGNSFQRLMGRQTPLGAQHTMTQNALRGRPADKLADSILSASILHALMHIDHPGLRLPGNAPPNEGVSTYRYIDVNHRTNDASRSNAQNFVWFAIAARFHASHFCFDWRDGGQQNYYGLSDGLINYDPQHC
ncbi:hypothetical protein NA57DRAFT_70927 [Rhizodiscina lignyota]|uniref:Uncharacterized protein n=1 Tax=Rhizodiscina lignyota TaxID=1504668 RepID=A0A9P4INE9_9PEZI|nr:hypothetical protein NA57DRAFT_70927 [Rhizodiscina lignyota]